MRLWSLLLVGIVAAAGCETYAERVEREHAPGGAASISVNVQVVPSGSGGVVGTPPYASGRVFFCSRQALVGPATPAPSSASSVAPACEPDCSPGSVCLRGVCVEACNPKCEAPAICGADRICHK
jgi:hypothetical protein